MPAPSSKSHHPEYGRLTAYLAACKEPRITLSFSQLEQEILLGLLPWAARTAPGWWSNTPTPYKPQSRAWLDAGWRVATANRIAETVTFDRSAPSP
jgi:hypothetical protein